jgi:hypothetical protein
VKGLDVLDFLNSRGGVMAGGCTFETRVEASAREKGRVSRV